MTHSFSNCSKVFLIFGRVMHATVICFVCHASVWLSKDVEKKECASILRTNWTKKGRLSLLTCIDHEFGGYALSPSTNIKFPLPLYARGRWFAQMKKNTFSSPFWFSSPFSFSLCQIHLSKRFIDIDPDPIPGPDDIPDPINPDEADDATDAQENLEYSGKNLIDNLAPFVIPYFIRRLFQMISSFFGFSAKDGKVRGHRFLHLRCPHTKK